MSGSLARIRIEKAEISCELKLAHKEIQSLKAKEHLSQLKTKKEAANVAFNAGRLQEAYDLYTAALKIDPENKDIGSRLYSNRALVLVKVGLFRRLRCWDLFSLSSP
ncbi:hypothetical protein BC938DRAFT_473780 [Jimgerdemannia flammicorona]|uniref:Uncharacterized protein n=1 Tax=Jimgerdemannia flammicorona TaxID=994334 RepID=A0A433Q3I6_9FUNG|nr:hypothetical protein BC938DRAFT_473780 [Jimgerdemannia flammicorona]